MQIARFEFKSCFYIFQESRISLLRTAEYYNFVREKTEKCEFDIIFGQIEVIEADLKILLENFTWINFGTLYVLFSFSTFYALIVTVYKHTRARSYNTRSFGL